MNLTKYFNFKFLKEHIKSQAQFIFSIASLVPILLIFNLVLLILNQRYGIVLFSDVSRVTMIGSYIIPVVLAFAMFGFIHKKKRVDFYLSQPINRSTVYFSNTLGGLSLIIILMLINTLILIIFNYVSPLFIPWQMLLDYFLYYTVSYCFLFAISSLAIFLSGNFISTLVVIFLLTLMYPFTTLVDTAFHDSSRHHMYYVAQDCHEIECYNELTISDKNYTYTTLINSLVKENYQTAPVIKTAVLTVIYLGFGYYVFLKRKMEDNECSFKNLKLYYTIKLLTFLPVSFLSYILLNDHNASSFLIAIAIPFGYYILYDLIMQKGYKNIRLTFISLGLAFPLFLGFYYGLDYLIYPKTIKISKVDKIIFDNYYHGVEYYTNLEITDPLVIEKVLGNNSYGFYDYGQTYHVTFKYHGYYYTDTFYWTTDDGSFIDDYIDSQHILSDKEKFDFKKTSYIDLSANKTIKIPVTSQIIKECQNVSPTNDTYGISVNLYYYANHQYYERQVPINANLELFQDMSALLNQAFIQEADYERVYITPYTVKYIGLDERFENYYLNYYVMNKSKDKVKEFLINHQNDKITDLDNSIVLEEYNPRNQQINYYIIADIDAFLIEWEKWNYDLEDTPEYKQYQEEYEMDYYK